MKLSYTLQRCEFNDTVHHRGTEVNTQFDVVFEYSKDKLTLKKFGMIQDIPAEWEQALVLDGSKSKQEKIFTHNI